jgi:hypothetical protein
MNYYQLPAVSNSDFTTLRYAYNGEARDLSELEDVFNFGSLVDAMLTDRSRLNERDRILHKEDGEVIRYTPEIWDQARKLARACERDPVIAQLLKSVVGQYVFVRTVSFTYQEEEISLVGKCKFDLFTKQFRTGLELKTTACTNARQFREAIDFFDWDRAAAWYMDLARIDRYWIAGVSKKNGEIFKHAIQRGDELYSAGLKKYSFWGYRWATIVEPFNIITR